MFTFFNELDVLEERLEYLYSHVDFFVICESDTSHVGTEKCLYYNENKERFKKYEDRIIHLIYPGNINAKNAWENENLQRNYIFECINFSQDDKVLISDVDEIPSHHFVSRLLNYEGASILIAVQELSFFWPNYRRNDMPYWIGGTRGFNIRYLNELYSLNNNFTSTYLSTFNKGTTLTKVRMTNTGIPINNGGWHLSYMGGKMSIKNKVRSFAHTEEKERIGQDLDKFIDDFVRTGRNFFGSNEYYISYGTFNHKFLVPRYDKIQYLTFFLRISWYLQRKKLQFKIYLKYYAKLLLRV